MLVYPLNSLLLAILWPSIVVSLQSLSFSMGGVTVSFGETKGPMVELGGVTVSKYNFSLSYCCCGLKTAPTSLLKLSPSSDQHFDRVP